LSSTAALVCFYNTALFRIFATIFDFKICIFCWRGRRVPWLQHCQQWSFGINL